VFNSIDDFEQQFLDGGPYSQKGDGVIAQVKVIRETKPLIKARNDWHIAESAVRNADWVRNGEKPKTPAQKAKLVAKADKAGAKYRKLLAAQAAKATKTKFVGGGWCSE
jgi:hypothetical protein